MNYVPMKDKNRYKYNSGSFNNTFCTIIQAWYTQPYDIIDHEYVLRIAQYKI